MKTNKKVLITGITGMVGSHLLDFLIDNTDWDIYGLCRWRSPLDNIEHVVPLINSRKRVFLLYGDITDITSLYKHFNEVQFDYVYHLAAQSYPLTSFDSPCDTYNTNIIGTENILRCCYQYCPKAVIHVCSSSEVFGRVPVEFTPIKEDCRFHPASPYAISKCGTDLIGQYYAEAYRLNIQITRMFTHTGPRRGDVFMESSFAKQIALIEANMLDPVVYVGNLQSLRTIADVRDAVEAYYLVTTIDPSPGCIYNIGGKKSMTVGDVLTFLISQSIRSDIEYKVDRARLRPIDADLQIPDTSKFFEKTGWIPKYNPEETLTDLLDYWRKKVMKNQNGFLQR